MDITYLEQLIAYLRVNLNNLKKCPNREYLSATLTKKKQFCQETYDRAIVLLEDLNQKISKEDSEHYKNNIERIYSDLLIEEKLKKLEMPPKLDLGIALKLVEKFNGEAEKLTSCFEAVDLLKDYYADVSEADLLIFFQNTVDWTRAWGNQRCCNPGRGEEIVEGQIRPKPSNQRW